MPEEPLPHDPSALEAEVAAAEDHLPPQGEVPTVGDSNIGMVRDSVSTFFAQILNIALSLVASIILGRSIAPTGKGLLAILILIPKSAWTFGTLGLDQVNTVYAGREPERRHELATTTLTAGLLLSIVVCTVVAIMLYWPGIGAARVDIRPGDFLVAVNGKGYRDPAQVSPGPGSSTLQVSIWRQGTVLQRTITVEESQPSGQTTELFRLSALNSWRYGLSLNPLFATERWIDAIQLGVVPLGPAEWADLHDRLAQKISDPGTQLPPEEPAWLVTNSGPSSLVAKLFHGRPTFDLRPGDFITSVAGLAPPADRAAVDDFLLQLPSGPIEIERWRDGTSATISVTPQESFARGGAPSVERGLQPTQGDLRHLNLVPNLAWKDQILIPSLGLSIAPLTDERVADLAHRKAAFAHGTTVPTIPGALITQVGYPFLRRWSQDIPPWLFMLTMLFFPLTATAYLMDSILYGLNLIALKNQKTVWTNAMLAFLYFVVILVYGVKVRHYDHSSPEGLMHLLELAVYVTLIHGVLIEIYSYYLIRSRASFGRQYLNFPYLFRCFKHIGWQSYIANSATYLFYDVDVLIIKWIIDWGTTSMTLGNLGNYTQAANIIERVWIIPGSIATALLPKLTNFGVERAGELTPKSVRHTLVLTFAILVPLCLLMPFLVQLFWGPEFMPLLGPFYLLAPGIFIFSMSRVYSSHLLGIGKPKYAMWCSVLTLVINVTMNLVLIPRKEVIHGIPIGGINGAALASTIAYTIHSILLMAAYCRESGQTPATIFRFTRDDWGLYVRGWNGIVKTGRRFLRLA